MKNLIFKGLNGPFKIATATQYITRIKDSTKNEIHETTLKTIKNKVFVSKLCKVTAWSSICSINIGSSLNLLYSTALLPIIAGYQLPPDKIQIDIT